MAFYVYIMASRRNGTLYIGSTDDIAHRAWEHREKVRPNGFAARYGCTMLVWYAPCDTRDSALLRERQMKEWRRSWKLRLIEESNPDWKDLYDTLGFCLLTPSPLPGRRPGPRSKGSGRAVGA